MTTWKRGINGTFAWTIDTDDDLTVKLREHADALIDRSVDIDDPTGSPHVEEWLVADGKYRLWIPADVDDGARLRVFRRVDSRGFIVWTTDDANDDDAFVCSSLADVAEIMQSVGTLFFMSSMLRQLSNVEMAVDNVASEMRRLLS